MKLFKRHVGKIVILGDSTVGKTAVLESYLSSGLKYPQKYNMNTAVTCTVKDIFLPEAEDSVLLLFYDSTGLDLYYNLLSKYWENPDMLLLIYDVTVPSSYDNINRWVEVAKSVKWVNGANDRPLVGAIFANKTDLVDRRSISTEKGYEIADRYEIRYFEGSAKMNEGLNDMFQWFGQNYYNYLTNLRSEND